MAQNALSVLYSDPHTISANSGLVFQNWRVEMACGSLLACQPFPQTEPRETPVPQTEPRETPVPQTEPQETPVPQTETHIFEVLVDVGFDPVVD